ncbi:MAG TPA: lipoate--protein ligase family protein [Candidatus Omnitrophota bacterium]|nr:lipoate--protein ligase family protein [Candidatus Omnitrophota bacterium]HPS19427.1 lipoate--protein ligase family protein [Candidatus Omnitrophota bacterium]
MKIITADILSPEELIAADEYILTKAESGDMGETLRFWGSKKYFVVLGRSGKAGEECFLERCKSDGIPVIRRISGGGTVLQGPGCLNYSLILSNKNINSREIRSSFEAVLGKIIGALKDKGIDAEFFPVSDLAVSGKKFSGNAQARKKDFFLQHGTFLLDFDINKATLYLKHPPKEPIYRKGREHGAFMDNIGLSENEIKEMILSIWPVDGEYKLFSHDLSSIKELVLIKYSQDAWNLVF